MRQLKNHVKAREQVVDIARNVTFDFASVSEMNTAYWKESPDPKATGTDWIPKRGQRESALIDLFENPGNFDYKLGCQDTAMLIQYYASLKAAGSIKQPEGADEDDWIPGDAGFIENNYFFIFGDLYGATRGENIIYLGNGDFFGHNPEDKIRKLKKWIEEVNSWAHNLPYSSTVKSHRYRPPL